MHGQNNSQLPFWQETFFTEPEEAVKEELKDLEFYNWQCVSLVRWGGTTLDLIIRDEEELMALINVIQQSIYKPEKQKRLRYWEHLRLKMKIGFESWTRHQTPKMRFLQALI